MNFGKLLTYESRQYMAKLDAMVADLLESGDQMHIRVLGLARKLWDAGIYNVQSQKYPWPAFKSRVGLNFCCGCKN